MAKTLDLLAFDLGASNGRALLGSFDGNRIQIQEICQFPNGPERIHHTLYWNALQLFSAIKVALKKAHSMPTSNIASLGLDTWGVDYGLLDRNGELLANPYHYRDHRTHGLLEEVLAILSKEEIYQETGIQFLPFNTLIQLYADLKYRPYVFECAKTLLFMPDLLNYFLTKEKKNEYTIASTSQFFNPKTDQWATSILNRLKIPSHLFEPLIYPGEIFGDLSPEVMRECGLHKTIPVVAVGSHDTASAVAATPFQDSKKGLFISSGTWSLLGVELEAPMINERSMKENMSNECGVGRTITFLKNISGLWLLQACKKSWEKEGLQLTYGEIERAARESKAGQFTINPDDPSFLNPQDMPTAIQEHCKEKGGFAPKEYGEMARCIYESLALTYHSVIKGLEALLGTKLDTIHMVGGGVKAELLCQFTANATKKRVIAGPIEATAIGNMVSQLIALGEILDLKEGREMVRRSCALKERTPME